MSGVQAIEASFQKLREKHEAALICFITAGDPDLQALPQVIGALESGGADLIEIGIPFSDPIADGPTIQASSQRALDAGVNPTDVLNAVADLNTEVPLLLMGYWNPILQIGPERFIQLAQKAGSCGAIVSDMIPEEASEWIRIAKNHEFATIFLAAPTSPSQRIAEVCNASSGFVYAVARTGVTGAGGAGTGDVSELVARIRTHTDLPVCVGFGVRGPEDVTPIASVADGVVVGSALVDLVKRTKDYAQLQSFVSTLKAATRRN